MAVGEARHEAVRRPLTDIAGREDDSLRVIVAETEDRIGEVVREADVGAQRRQIQLARLDDRPVAAVDLDVGVARVDDLRRNLLPLVDDLHRRDLPRGRLRVLVAERDDGVLDGDEVAVAEVSGGAVVGLAEIVVRVQLDEARTALAKQLHRQQPHLALQLLLDLRDHPRARSVCVGARRPAAGGRGHRRRLDAARAIDLGAHLGPQRLHVVLVRRARHDIVPVLVNDRDREAAGRRRED